MAFQEFFQVFLQVFQMHVSSVSSVFRRMLQMFHLNISKVDRVLHMLQRRWWLANSGLPQGFGSYLALRASPSPLPPIPSLHSISPRQFELSGETLPEEHADAHRGAGPRWADGGAMPTLWPLRS